jgi:hypothetical protein
MRTSGSTASGPAWRRIPVEPEGARVNVVSRLRLWRLERRLDRIWRRGQVDRVLSALRTRIGSTFLVSARAVSTEPVCVAEIAWLDGFSVRLGLCHLGAVADLALLLDNGQIVTLSRAVRSGSVWSLDFALGDRSFPLLAGAVTIGPGGGGGVPPITPLVLLDA